MVTKVARCSERQSPKTMPEGAGTQDADRWTRFSQNQLIVGGVVCQVTSALGRDDFRIWRIASRGGGAYDDASPDAVQDNCPRS